MNVGCHDRERVLAGENPQEMEALRRHAAGCAACRGELALWDGISAAAPLLRKNWESPELWPRIHQTLAEESLRAPRRRAWSLESFWAAWAGHARTALAGLVLLAVSIAGAMLVLKNGKPSGGSEQVVTDIGKSQERRLLTHQALRDAEKREAEYIASIERLEKLAEPRLQQASTPLMQNYREKLLVLDSAIAELRAQAEQNRFNAHLRREMTSLYREKQRTLEDVLREER